MKKRDAPTDTGDVLVCGSSCAGGSKRSERRRHPRRRICVLIPIIIWVLGCTREAPPVAEAAATPEQWFEIYFSQVYSGDPAAAERDANNIDKQLVRKISAATQTIDAALHELDSDRIADALIAAHQRGVRVRIVTETDYADEISIQQLQQAGVPVRTDQGRNGLMHNKFLILDQRAVWTGSFNTTDNCAYKNNNNGIFIRSKELAENFSVEFEELWAGNFGGSSSRTIPHPTVTMPDGTAITTLFAPEGNVTDAIVDTVRSARRFISFMAFSFTDDQIGDAIIERFRAGVKVGGVFEKRGSSTPYSEFGRMRDLGMTVMQDTNRYAMHHKVIVIDGTTVITGSFNFSRNAAETNDENLLILRGNREIARAYLDEYERLSGSQVEVSDRDQPVATTGGKININTATREQLMTLDGIGPVLADRMIAGRPFASVEDLLKVKGIGEKTLRKIRDKVIIE